MNNSDENKGKILIVDDDKFILLSLEVLLKQYFEKVVVLQDPNDITETLKSHTFDVVILDMNFEKGETSGDAGIFWLQKIKKNDPHTCIITITAYGEISKAVRTVKAGAMDFVVKPWENEKLLSTVLAARELSKSRRRIDHLRSQRLFLDNQINKDFSDIIGESKEMKSVIDQIERIAPTDANILIYGENGTGKEVIARAIHKNSRRNHEVLINVDMGSISESLFESELFGHEKGAFTDAKERRIGRFEAASGGTLFLDEIANLPMNLQSKLLKVLQERKITRIGSNQEIDVDIRLICATNVRLDELIENGKFRQDLYYRINTVELHIPPLNKRPEDIPVLAEHFFQIYKKKYKKTQLQFPEYVAKKLSKFSWPGNVRELQHAIERAVIMCNEKSLRSSDFSFLQATTTRTDTNNQSYNLEHIEKKAIKECLKKHTGNLTKTATELGLTRGALYRRIEKYGL
jgi:DNA-binding NtrC family response regulator